MNTTPAPTSRPEVTDLVRYTHLDKTHGHLPGMQASQPAIFGLSGEQYRQVREEFVARAEEAAVRLLDEPRTADRIDRWAARDPHTILAVGDSITDDLLSWVELLRGALRLRAPEHAVRLVNGGLSAHTTAMVLRRWPATVSAVRPDVVVCLLGGNDVTRVGPDATKPQVSLEESIANLRELNRIAGALAAPRWIWVTPATVDENRVGRTEAFRFGRSSWANADILALAERMRGLAGPLVDLTELFGVPAASTLVGDDGVHPTVGGQTAIARAVLEEIAP
jgi:lysophospholipase L1-like esterase